VKTEFGRRGVRGNLGQFCGFYTFLRKGSDLSGSKTHDVVSSRAWLSGHWALGRKIGGGLCGGQNGREL
jgi:hypothetical protein